MCSEQERRFQKFGHRHSRNRHQSRLEGQFATVIQLPAGERSHKAIEETLATIVT
jgi:hypothetical protein